MNYLISPDNKLCLFWTEKCGCCTAVEIFFKYIGYDHSEDEWIHNSRKKYQVTQPKNLLPETIKLQIVRNPYDRAISGFFHFILNKGFLDRGETINYYYNEDFKEKILKWSKTVVSSDNNQEITELMKQFFKYLSYANNLDFAKEKLDPKNFNFLRYHISNPQFKTENLDFIIKLENLESDLNSFNKKFNFSLENSRYDKHSVKKMLGKDFYKQTISQIYSFEPNQKIVQILYKKDFEYFNYPTKIHHF
jgi:hypothetical protein